MGSPILRRRRRALVAVNPIYLHAGRGQRRIQRSHMAERSRLAAYRGAPHDRASHLGWHVALACCRDPSDV